MSLGIRFKKMHLIKIGTFAWYSVKIRVILVSVWKTKSWNKKQTDMKTETCKLYSRVLGIFLPNVIKIDHVC